MNALTQYRSASRARVREASVAAIPGADLTPLRHRLYVRRDARSALRMYRRSPIFRQAIAKLANAAAAQEWMAASWVDGGRTEQTLPEHPMSHLLMRGNALMPGLQMRRVLFGQYYVVGEAFEYIPNDRLGLPLERYIISPHWVQQIAMKPGDPYIVQVPGHVAVEVPFEHMVYHRDPDLEEPYERGAGVGEALIEDLNADERAAEHIASVLSNQGLPAAIVSSRQETQPLTQTQLEELRVRFDSFRGAGNSGKTAFFSSPVDIQQIGFNPEQLQMKELREFERDLTMSGVGIAPELMGVLTASNRSTIDSAEHLTMKFTVYPALASFRATYDERLARRYGNDVCTWFENPVQDDKEFRRSVMAAQPDAFTLDEHRSLAGFGPLSDEKGEAFPLSPLVEYGDHYSIEEIEAEREELSAIEAEDEPLGLPSPDKGHGCPRHKTVFERKGDLGLIPISDECGEWECGAPAAKSTIRTKLTAADISRALRAVSGALMLDALAPGLKSMIGEEMESVLTDLGVAVAFDVISEELLDFMASPKTGEHIRGITNTTRRAIRRQMRTGIQAGETSEQIEGRIRHVFERATRHRAEMIARTEIVRASNHGSHAAFTEAGVEKKEWLATAGAPASGPGAVRDAHKMLDGTRVDNGKPFSIGTDTGMYPGDFSRPENSINCRCVVLPVIEEARSSDADAEREKLWKALDRRRRRHERVVAAGAKMAFQKQLQAVVDVIRAAG